MLQTFNPSTVEAEARRSFDKASRTGESSEPELHSKTPSQKKKKKYTQAKTKNLWVLAIAPEGREVFAEHAGGHMHPPSFYPPKFT